MNRHSRLIASAITKKLFAVVAMLAVCPSCSQREAEDVAPLPLVKLEVRRDFGRGGRTYELDASKPQEELDRYLRPIIHQEIERDLAGDVVEVDASLVSFRVVLPEVKSPSRKVAIEDGKAIAEIQTTLRTSDVEYRVVLWTREQDDMPCVYAEQRVGDTDRWEEFLIVPVAKGEKLIEKADVATNELVKRITNHVAMIRELHATLGEPAGNWN